MAIAERPDLRRALTLPLLVFYGLSVTIGAGIYVLIGAIAAEAGFAAYAAFLVAAAAMVFTALTYCELTTRYPVSAGVAAFVLRGFGRPWASAAAGLLVIAVGLVSAAAIASGSVGYLQEFADLPRPLLLSVVVVAMAAIAAWGIRESALFAAVLSAVEIGGLLIIVAASFFGGHEPAATTAEIVASAADPDNWRGIFAAALLAVFAFIGFESLANVAEEAEHPERAMPRAILLTLVLSALLYMALAIAVLGIVGPEELSRSAAPLGLAFERSTGLDRRAFAALGVLATLNGVIVQLIMVSRLMHGMARQGNLPATLGHVNATTQTPLKATALAAALVLAAVIAVPLERLAEATSAVMLFVYALVNAALIAIKRRGDAHAPGVFRVWPAVPIFGLVSSFGLLAAAFFV